MNGINDPRFIATVDLIRRAGASEIQFRYSGKPTEQDGPPEYEANDPVPVFWMVGARIRFLDGQVGYEVSAALNPADAAVRLAKLIIGGSVCVHCKRGVSVSERWDETPPDTGDCWYVFDPELDTFRRSCEGEARVGRNDPCLCGSGRKFKHCHGAAHS